MTSGYKDLKPEEKCIHRPEPSWFDLKRGINELVRETSLSSLPGSRTY